MDFIGLESLPVEVIILPPSPGFRTEHHQLLYEVQLHALSESFPITSRHIYAVFQLSPASFRSQYLSGRAFARGPQDMASIFTKILRYPICTEEVVEHLVPLLAERGLDVKASRFDIPKRLFRSLAPKPGSIRWKEQEPPLLFLQYLFDSPGIPKPNVNSHGGYALTKAVHAKFIPLIRFLLDYGAEPQCKNCLAIFVAIRQKDLALVKLLIERDDSSYTDCLGTGKRKRRKLEDRVVVNSAMLKAAVKCDARDIVDYMAREKGCIPDMQTLHMMAK
ncbi:hypothetical protein J132_04434 [Termitomyces sp. J132]|nr:hypothetical protein J132_04434 [Termitomyces sp. J132]